MINLEGQVAFVTGASGSIGAAIAHDLHKLGAYVYLSGSNMAKLEQVAASLGDNCSIKPCDLRNIEEAGRLLDDIEKLDILVCNAGVTNDNLAIRMTDEDFDDVLIVNLKSSFALNRAAIKKMMRARYGRIINISSVVGVSGNAGQANYCASKAGLIGMTKSLALEVASRGVTVNAIAPGFVESNMTDKLNEEQKQMILPKIPAGRFGTPEDISSVICYLASPLAAYITGQTIHVNGGMLLV
jgi:3-oxoacyl-[acyl-carrier protein] reductase